MVSHENLVLLLSLLLLNSLQHFGLAFGVDLLLVLLLFVFLEEGVKKDSQEEVQKNEVA